jgi:hypothetical protein
MRARTAAAERAIATFGCEIFNLATSIVPRTAAKCVASVCNKKGEANGPRYSWSYISTGMGYILSVTSGLSLSVLEYKNLSSSSNSSANVLQSSADSNESLVSKKRFIRLSAAEPKAARHS